MCTVKKVWTTKYSSPTHQSGTCFLRRDQNRRMLTSSLQMAPVLFSWTLAQFEIRQTGRRLPFLLPNLTLQQP